ncbi:hypothetical protein ACFL3P_05370 [Pseudomonadota bacterium]
MNILPHMISHVTEIEPLSDIEIEQINLYKERAVDLSLSQEKYQNIPISSYSTNHGNRTDSFESNTPEIDHIIILATKFRFFYAEKERTQFEKVANLLRNKAKDEWARNYIDHIKLWYKDAMKSTDATGNLGHPVTNREILNLWFNSKFFHSDSDKRNKLDDIHQSVGEGASLFQLYLAIVKCSTNIQYLYSVVHQLNNEANILCTPNHHFRLNKPKHSDSDEAAPGA